MENMNYEFKDMATIDVAESVSDDAHVLVEDGGAIRRFPKDKISNNANNPLDMLRIIPASTIGETYEDDLGVFTNINIRKFLELNDGSYLVLNDLNNPKERYYEENCELIHVPDSFVLTAIRKITNGSYVEISIKSLGANDYKTYSYKNGEYYDNY